ncbi:ABC transporter ATP-binding protein [Synechococcus sp. TAK9802]|uniref:ATP-binding cassette domain-containing protein n=1 Tax=Synechococcus sp. TAK9802 TaxID=1442558 RepID=UPI001646CB1F|nr:ABC transporter ATP-binding protein [Synechococcus sp. TAK9802]QNI60489.1 ABC transporter type 1/ ATPase component [Synechococcus sp. TAK9802]
MLTSFFSTSSIIWRNLRVNRRVDLFILLSLMISAAVLELISIGFVFPLLSVLSNPSQIRDSISSDQFIFLLQYSDNSLIVFVATLFAISTLITMTVRLYALKKSSLIAAKLGHELSCKVFENYIFNTYEFHVSANSSIIISALTMQMPKLIASINSFFEIISSSLIVLFILLVLISANPILAAISILFFCVIYTVIAFASKKKIKANSIKIAESTRMLVQVTQESVGAIKDIILDGSHKHFLEKYTTRDFSQKILQANNLYISAYPRYLVEGFAMILVALIACNYAIQNNNLESVIPILGTFVLAIQKMLPAIQKIYRGWALISGYASDNKVIAKFLNNPTIMPIKPFSPKVLKQSIEFKDISYSYPSSNSPVLSHVNLRLKLGDCIGVVGKTGSGKSTLINLLMGLLIPKTGSIYIDDSLVCDYGRQSIEKSEIFRNNVAHVPQDIFLIDDTILGNITLGKNKSDILSDMLEKSLKVSELDRFVADLPENIHTFVGERGYMLSGGQKQRIGIARAIYKNSTILVLDEATSALDSQTQDQIMDNLEQIRQDKIIIMVAHRKESLRHCDKLISIENGIISVINSK